MYLALDIESKAGAIITQTPQKDTYAGSRLDLFDFVTTPFGKLLDEFILIMEGLYKHVPEFTIDEAQYHLNKAKKSIALMDEQDEGLASINYMDSRELKEKMKYLLKTLYHLEALLHKRVMKARPTEKTPDYLKQGLATLSNEAITKSLSK